MATSIIDTFITRYALQVDQQSARRVNNYIGGLQTRIRSLGGALTTLGIAGGFGLAGLTQALSEYSKVQNAIKNNLIDLRKGEKAAVEEATAEFKRYSRAIRLVDSDLRGVFTKRQHLEGIAALMTGRRSNQKAISSMYARAVVPTAVSEAANPEVTAKILTSVLRAFGLENMDDATANVSGMVGISNTLAGFATKHSLTFENLGQTLARLGEVAQSAGVSVQSMTGILTYLDSEGQDPSRVDTALRAILSQLANIGDSPRAVKNRLLSHGISPNEITSRFLGEGGEGFIPLLRLMKQSNVGSGTLRTLVGEESYVIFGKLIDEVDALAKHIREGNELSSLNIDGKGAARRRAGVMAGGLSGSLGAVTAELENLAIAIGDTGILAVLNDLAEGIASIVEMVRWLVSSITPTLSDTWRQIITGGAVATFLGRKHLGRAWQWSREWVSSRTTDRMSNDLHDLWQERNKKVDRRTKSRFYSDNIADLLGADRRTDRWTNRQRKKIYHMFRKLQRRPNYRGPSVSDLDSLRFTDRLKQMTPGDYRNAFRETAGANRKILTSIHNRRERNLFRNLGRASTRWIARMTRFLGSWGLLLSLGLELIPLLVRNWRGIIEFFQSPIQNLSRWFESLSGLQAPMKTPEQMTHEKKMREQHLYYDNWKKNMERLGIDRPSAGDKSASLNVNIGDIHVSAASNETGEDIATGIRTSLVNQMHSALENFDSMVRV